jgi:hypothetical protein
LVLGGFNPQNFWSDEWQALLSFWGDKFGYSISYALSLESNFVWWSTIGGGDALSLLYPRRALEGLIAEDLTSTSQDSMFMDMYKRNEFGFMPMPWQGTVLAFKPLGKGLMVYGDNGIAYLYPVVEPFPTYGLESILEIGIASRGAMGGGIKEHVWIDSAGALWRITTEFKPEKIGYEEFFSPLIANAINIVYNPQEDEYRISGYDGSDTQGYLLTRSGLSKVPQALTGGSFVSGGLIGVTDTTSESDVIVCTDVFDMGYREDKTITTVEVSFSKASAVHAYICADYRYDGSSEFRTTPWVRLNDKGWERLNVTATEFRLRIKIGSWENVQITDVNVRWQMSNKQTVRGLSAAQIE